MVRISLAIGRQVDDTWSIRDMGVSAKRKEINLLLVRERSRRLLSHKDFKDKATTIKAKARPGLLTS